MIWNYYVKVNSNRNLMSQILHFKKLEIVLVMDPEKLILFEQTKIKFLYIKNF